MNVIGRRNRNITPEQLIENNISRVPFSGCWIWMACVSWKGYGSLMFGAKTWAAHRFSYTHFIGEIPDGLLVCHRCDVPSCVNPDHLFAGTNQDNIIDCVKKGRHWQAGIKQCPKGHPYDEKNTYKRPNTGAIGCKTCRADATKAYRERKL